MELNGLNSDDYIYLRLNRDIDNNQFNEKEGTVIGFPRDALESNVFSSAYYGLDKYLNITPKKDIKDTDILPNQINESMVFKEDTIFDIRLDENRSYVLNDWLSEHLKNDKLTSDYNLGYISITDYNINSIRKYSSKSLPEGERYPHIITGDEGTVRLKLTFKAGEVLDFTDPGVMSLFYDPCVVELLASSSAVLGEEKEEYFKNDFQNTFFAMEGTIIESENLYRYYRIKDGLKIKSYSDLGTYEADVAIKDDDDFIQVVYLKRDDYECNQFDRYDIKALSEVATEIPLEEAEKIHADRVQREQEAHDRSMEEFYEMEARREEALESAYEENADNEEIFPGTRGEFVQTYKEETDEEEEKKKYTLDEIKEFYTKLKTINEEALKYMYFYGGTIPYLLVDASTSREFGDVDIFVPIEAMRLVREELNRQQSFHVDFDSINVTSRVGLVASIPEEQKEASNQMGLGILYAMMNPNATNDELGCLFGSARNRTLQDFGLKGSLFGVNISIFPIYQYNNDLMAKSFNITDTYEYLLAVRVMDNMAVKDFAKNIKICGNALNILPIEYVIISKESAIEKGYQKRAEKDKEDLAFIEENKEKLEIDEELKQKLKDNYPDYSISQAYFVGGNGVEEIGGEKYKELMLLNKGEWLS